MNHQFHYQVLLFLILFSAPLAVAHTTIKDVSELAIGKICKIFTPTSIPELQQVIKCSKLPVAVAGGRFSQGGHIWYNGGITIDMTKLNAVRKLDPVNKIITVEAGATWHQIQKYIDLYGLSVRVMQSYNDFTVGGSLSVNVHSRTIFDGPIIETVESIKLLLADGSLVVASRTENYDLFKAAIGGYGAVGIIVEATLSLTSNDVMERQEVIMSLEHYPAFFATMIKNNPAVVFHNADLFTDNFNKVASITWYKTDKPRTIEDRLQAGAPFSFEYFGFQCARYIQAMQKIRLPMHIMKSTDKVVWRNYEMSTSVASIEPTTRLISTTVLQEYFVPCDQLVPFVQHMKEIVQKYNVNMMNVSLRYIHKDTESVMAYAQAPESFALVCYINMGNNVFGMAKARRWTQELINCVIDCGGTYYLPYQLHATKEQFEKVYPRSQELREIKKRVDPNNRFMNSFLKKYII